MSHPYYEARRRMPPQRGYNSSPERDLQEALNPERVDDPYVTPLIFNSRLSGMQAPENGTCATVSCCKDMVLIISGQVHNGDRTQQALLQDTMVNRYQFTCIRTRSRICTVSDAHNGWHPLNRNNHLNGDPVDRSTGHERLARAARPVSVPPSRLFRQPPIPQSIFVPHYPPPIVPIFAVNEPPPPRPFPMFRGGLPGHVPVTTQAWSVPGSFQHGLPSVSTFPYTLPLPTHQFPPMATSGRVTLWPVEDWPPRDIHPLSELILYPLLLAFSPGHPVTRWNMQEFPHELHRLSRRGLYLPITDDEMKAPVSHPPFQKMKITIRGAQPPHFPPICVSSQDEKPLTFRDVLDTIFHYLHTRMTAEEYGMLEPLKMSNVKRAYYQRCNEGHLGLPEYDRRRGVKRIDWFEGNSMFGGLQFPYANAAEEICCSLSIRS